MSANKIQQKARGSMKTSCKMLIIFLTAMSLLSFAQSTLAQSNAGITYQGRILKPNGQPLSGSNTQFRLQIRTPGAQDCLMFEEVQSQDLSDSSGSFSLTINDGSGLRTDSSTYGLDRIFANQGSFTFNPATCNSGSTYAPNQEDGRKLVVYFKDETMSTWEAMPSQKINFVPLALESKQVQGFSAQSLVRVQDSGGAMGNIAPLSNANYTKLLDLIDGKLNGATLPTMTSGQVLGWNGTSWTSSDPLASVQTFAKTTLPACAPGQFLKDNGSGLLVCGTPTGTATGTVTEVSAGTGLTTGGSPITTTGSIALATLGAGGTGFKVTYDTYGRVTAAAALIEADIPNLTTAGKVSGDAITSGTIGGTTAINTSGTITTTGAVSTGALTATSVTAPAASLTALSTQSVQVFETTNNYKVTIQAPAALAANYSLTLPTTAGVNGKVLGTTGGGVLTWVDQTADTGITALTGAVTASGSGSVVATITDKAVTLAKMNDLPTKTLIGNSTAATGAPEAITLGSGLSLTSGVLTNTVTDTDSFAALLGVCGNGYMPLKSAGVWTCVLATSAATNDAIVRRDSTGNFSAAAATLSAGLNLKDGALNAVSVNPASGTAAYSLTLPATAGVNGKILGTTGSGVLAWVDPTSASQWSNGAASAIYYNSGNVGVGTATPTAKLHVVGDLKSEGSVSMTNANQFVVQTNGDATTVISGGSNVNTIIDGYTNNHVVLAPSAANVGVGIATPLQKLHVNGGIMVGDTATCGAPTAGTIRYNGGNLQYCDGAWKTLGVAGSGLTALTGDVVASGPGSGVATIQANSVTSGKIADANVTLSKLATDSVDSTKLVDGSIVSADVADKAVTYAKIQDVAQARLLGRYSASNGVAQEISLGTGLALNSSTGVLSNTVTDTDSFAALLGVCGNGYVPYKNAGAWTCALATSAATNDAIMQRDSSGNFVAGAATLTGGLNLKNGALNAVTLAPSVTTSAYTLTLPPMLGTNGQVLTTNASGALSWTTPASTSGFWANGGNSFAAAASIGTNDNFDFSIKTNNTTAMTVAADGNIGIGTASPARKLTIAGSGGQSLLAMYAKDSTSGVGNSITFRHDTSGTGASTFVETAAIIERTQTLDHATLSSDLELTSIRNGAFPAAPTMILKSSGNVGIGTTSPTERLSVDGGKFKMRLQTSGNSGGFELDPMTLDNPKFTFHASDDTKRFTQEAVLGASTPDDSLNFSSFTVPNLMTFKGNGNIGINKTAPAYKLDVNGAINATAVKINGVDVVAGGGMTSLTGDVTGSGSGAVATTIAANAVTSAKIADGTIATADLADQSVTFAKMQNIATGKLLGRSTASAGSPEELSIGTGLAISGGALSSTVIDTDTFAAVTAACANTFVPYKSGGAWTCMQVASANTVSTLVQRDAAGNFVSGIATLDGLKLNNGGSILNIVNPIGGAWTMTLPATAGSANQVLTTNGAGLLSWTTPSAATPSQWTTSGSDIFYNVANGKVGIGTAAPTSDLDVGDAVMAAQAGKTMAVTSSSSRSSIAVGQSATDNGQIKWIYNATPADAYMFIGDWNSGTHALALQAVGGNVGIGTTNPQFQLSNNATNRGDSNSLGLGNAALNWYQSSNGYVAGFENGDATAVGRNGLLVKTASSDANSFIARFESAGVPKFVVSATGNVGIGTSTPTEKLNVYGGDVLLSGPTNAGIKLSTRDQYGYNYLDLTAQTATQGAGFNTRPAGSGVNSPYVFQFNTSTADESALLFLGRRSEHKHIITTSNDGSSGSPWDLVLRAAANGVNWAAAPDAVTLKAGTPGNTLYLDSTGKVGIGTATPFSKLTVIGNDTNSILTVTNNADNIYTSVFNALAPNVSNGNLAQFRVGKNTANNASAEFNFKPHATNSVFSFGMYGNSEIMSYDYAGNVGIGKAPTAYKVDVNGSVNATQLCIAGTCQTSWPAAGGTGDFKADGTVAMTASLRGSNGAVGAPSFSFSSDPNLGMYRVTTNTLGFSTAGGEKMRIDGTGRVGIGVTPTEMLHVKAANSKVVSESSTSTNPAIFKTISGGGVGEMRVGSESAAGGSTLAGSSGGSAFLTSMNLTPLHLGTGAVTRMTIDAVGRVGVGVESPNSLMHVERNANSEQGIEINNYSSGTSAVSSLTFHTDSTYTSFKTFGSNSGANTQLETNGNLLYFKNSKSTGAIAFGTNGDNERLRIDAAGNVGIATSAPTQKLEVNGNVLATAYLYTSDRRLKKDFVALDHSLEKLVKLNTVKFRWITPLNPEADREQIGLIAQDVQKVYPQAVTEDKKGFLRVNYMALIAPMIDSVRQLYAKVLSGEQKTATLEKQVAQLKEKNDQLEQRLRNIEEALKRAPASVPNSMPASAPSSAR